MVDRFFYFDVLPLRPRPEPMESLTGYLSRLGKENGVRSIRAWQDLLGDRDKARLPDLAMDYPVSNSSSLAILTQIHSARLQGLTYFHLICKFMSDPYGIAARDWLTTAITACHRFCPLCLAESPYHRLLWRFEGIRVCTKHGCEIFSECPRCRENIPLRGPTRSIVSCPSCRSDLRECRSKLASDKNSNSARQVEEGLYFALSPQPWEWIGSDAPRFLARRLIQLRRSARWSVAQLAERAIIGQAPIRAAEQGKAGSGGATFKSYLDLCGALGVTMQDLFYQALPDILLGDCSDRRGGSIWFARWKPRADRVTKVQFEQVKSGIQQGLSGGEIGRLAHVELDVLYAKAFEQNWIDEWREMRAVSTGK